MKKYLFFVVALVFPVTFIQAQAQDIVPDERIDSFDVSLTVLPDSSLQVVETIDYNFGQQQKHGIFREIPYKYKARGGNFSLDISEITVSDSKRRELKKNVSRSGGNVVIRIGDPAVYITGSEVYKISYTVKRAINFFDAHDELYWNITGDSWEVPIIQSSATVFFANGDEKNVAQLLKRECFVGIFGSTQKCTISDDVSGGGVFSARELLPGEGLTIVAGFAKGLIIKPSLFDAFIDFLRDNLIILLPFASILFMWIHWYRRGRDPEISGAQSVVAQWEIPQVDGRDLRPYEVGIVIDEVSNRGDFSSLFIDLAVRGYFRIEKLEKKWFLGKADYQLTKIREWHNDASLEDFEKIFLNGVFGETVNLKNVMKKYEKITTDQHGRRLNIKELLANGDKIATKMQKELEVPTAYKDEILISSLRNEFYKKYEDVVRAGYKSVSDKKLFVKNPQSVRLTYIIGATLVSVLVTIFFYALIVGFFGWIVMVSVITSILAVGFFGWIMPRKTMEGVRVHRKILGLKKYLEAAEKRPIAMMQSPNAQIALSPAVFEKYLPYAMVLGVEKQWARQFEGIYDARESGWFRGGEMSDFSAGGMSNMTKGFAAAAGAVALSKPSSASSGGSGFSGGGSGGGGGGGGGGSW